MNYDNEIIRSIADVGNRLLPRKLAIADSSKVKNISLSTLEITAAQMGLLSERVAGTGEEGQDVEFLLVAADEKTLDRWVVELTYAALFGSTRQQRNTLQINMGKALGYDDSSILDFLMTDESANCKCTCCGGDSRRHPREVV